MQEGEAVHAECRQAAHATDPSTDRNLGSSKELDAGDGEDKVEAWME